MSTPSNPPPAETPLAPAQSRLARAANSLVLGIARHWLALFNIAVALYLLLPMLAPLFTHWGWTGPAGAIYGIYAFACHQLPDHSYFLFGAEPLYSLPMLEANGLAEGLGILERRGFIGNPELGYKVAICQRDMAIYASVLVAGLLFALVRRRLRSPSLRVYLLFLIPIALDGLTGLFGLRESNWWLRTLTGALFGAASVWLAYPYIEEAMNDLIETEQNRGRPDKVY